MINTENLLIQLHYIFSLRYFGLAILHLPLLSPSGLPNDARQVFDIDLLT